MTLKQPEVVIGMAAKSLVLLVWRIFHVPELLPFWTTYDPGAFWFAESVSALLFDQRGIAPSTAEAMKFCPR